MHDFSVPKTCSAVSRRHSCGLGSQERRLRGDAVRDRRTLTWTIDGRAIAVGPGQAVCIPRGAVHRFDNFGTEDAKQLSIVIPAIMGPAYFREASAVVNAASGGPLDMAKMVEIFRRHGMTIAELPPTR